MAMKKTSLLAAVVAVTAAGAGLIGCADDSGGGLSAILDEYEFTPNSWTVTAGAESTIELENRGSLEHEWVVLRDGVRIQTEEDLPDDESELQVEFIFVETELASGVEADFTFTAPGDPGTYQVICAIAGHFDQGMQGELTVNLEGGRSQAPRG